jgi:regulator of protease activity HflC (stomatin/prohibitin superfamily)
MFAILVLVALGGVLLFKSLIKVWPGQRVIVWKKFGVGAGRAVMLEPGLHFLNPFSWAVFGQGPFAGLIKSAPHRACPAPLSIVSVDPDRVEIMSSDNVPGTANVAVELQVLEWSASEIVSVNVPFLARASIIINQWVSNALRSLVADKLWNYAEVVTCLNDPLSLKLLNEKLKECFMEARRVSLDPRGIQLHQSYTDTVGATIQKTRRLALQRLDAQAELELAEQKLRREMLEIQAKCERDKIEAESQRSVEKSRAEGFASRAAALLTAGLSPASVAGLLSSEVSVGALSRADKVYVGMHPTVLGMRGFDHSTGLGDMYEKV